MIRKLIVVLLVVLIHRTALIAQIKSANPCMNLIENPEFIDLPSNFSRDIGQIGTNLQQVCSPWQMSHGSPTFSSNSFRKTFGNGSAVIWCGYGDPPNQDTMYGEGILTNSFSLKAGKPYLFSMLAEDFTINGGFSSRLRADFSSFVASSNYAVPSYANFLNVQNIIWRSPFSSRSYNLLQRCIVPDRAWNNIWIHHENDSLALHVTAWIGIDDVELIPNFDFAGEDKRICLGESTTIGDDCSYLHINFIYLWRKMSSGFIIGNTATLNVNPTLTTTYILKRIPLNADLADCWASDTITVFVTPFAPKPCLGNDTVICKPGCFVISNPYINCSPLPNVNPGSLEFSVNGKTTPIKFPYTICESGTYIMCAYNKGFVNCFTCDTIKVKFHPEIPHRDTVLYYCGDAFPQTLTTYFGYRYQWQSGKKGDTLQSYMIKKEGKYIVSLKDSNGCITFDTFNVKLKYPPLINLPNDTVLCGGGSLLLDAGIGMKSYLWNTSDTSRYLLVTKSGKYAVKVMSYDSCYGSDSIEVKISQRPSFARINYGPFCISDSCVTLHVIPNGGKISKYSGNGVKTPNIFCPSVAGCGTHQINCHFEDSFGCSYDTSIMIKVRCPVPPKLDSIGWLCLTDSPVTLGVAPRGTTFSGSGVHSNKFHPGEAGLGWHYVKYCYSDSFGCSACDSFRIKVVSVVAEITPLDDTSKICNHSPIRLKASGGNHFYWLHNASIDSIVTVTQSGTYCVVVSNDTVGCADTACITISYKNCCDLEYTYPFSDPTATYHISPGGSLNYLHDTTMVLTGTIIVDPGASWTIKNCKLILKECARIVVSRGEGGTMAAKMNVYNSNLVGCQWKGIEVWGSWDDCNADTAGQVAGASSLQGMLIMENDTISDADIAILVGKRDDDPNVIWQQYAGGVIDITHCYFKQNYADIVFSEYSVVSVACEMYPFDCINIFHFSDYLVTRVENNVFDKLKDTEDCDHFLTTQLHDYGSDPWYCHIINFSDNPIYTKGPGIGFPPKYNPVCNDLHVSPMGFISMKDIRCKFNNNTYINPCKQNNNIPSGFYNNNNGYQ